MPGTYKPGPPARQDLRQTLQKQKGLKKVNKLTAKSAAEKEWQQETHKKRRPGAVAFPANTKMYRPDSERRKQWDLLMIMLLVFSAIVTPFEIAFLGDGDCGGLCCSPQMCILYTVNQLVTLLFVVDMYLIFNTAVFSVEMGTWVTQRSAISLGYLKGWFWIDFLSVLPFDLLGPYIFGSDVDLRTLALIRLIRLLRLLKLLRILRGARIIKRWQNKLAIPYSTQVVYKSAVLTIITCHWSACSIRLVSGMNRDACRDGCYFRVYDQCVSQNPVPESWPARGSTVDDDFALSSCYYKLQLQNYTTELVPTDDDLALNATDTYKVSMSNVRRYCASKCSTTNWLDEYGFGSSPISSQYIAAFYWGIYNLKGCDAFSISYSEYAISIVVMILGGGVWMLLLGDMCNVLGNLDVAGNTYRRNMDNLNQYLAENHFKSTLVVRLRAYFIHCKDLFANEFYKKTLMKMSPTLRSQVAHREHGSWVREISFFSKAPRLERRELVADLAVNFNPFVYVPGDALVSMGSLNKTMLVIHKGIAVKAVPPNLPLFISAGSVLGEDVLLRSITDKRQQRKYSASALTYVDTLEISSRQLLIILTSGMYPETFKSIRRYALRLYLRQAMPSVLKEAVENPQVHDFHDVAMLLTGELVNEVDLAVQQAEDEDDKGMPPEQMLKLMGRFDELDRNYRIMGHRMKTAASEIRRLRKELYTFMKSRGLIQSNKHSKLNVETTFQGPDKQAKEERMLIPRSAWWAYCKRRAATYAREAHVDKLAEAIDQVAESVERMTMFLSVQTQGQDLVRDVVSLERELYSLTNVHKSLLRKVAEESKQLRVFKAEHTIETQRIRGSKKHRAMWDL